MPLSEPVIYLVLGLICFTQYAHQRLAIPLVEIIGSGAGLAGVVRPTPRLVVCHYLTVLERSCAGVLLARSQPVAAGGH